MSYRESLGVVKYVSTDPVSVHFWELSFYSLAAPALLGSIKLSDLKQ